MLTPCLNPTFLYENTKEWLNILVCYPALPFHCNFFHTIQIAFVLKCTFKNNWETSAVYMTWKVSDEKRWIAGTSVPANTGAYWEEVALCVCVCVCTWLYACGESRFFDEEQKLGYVSSTVRNSLYSNNGNKVWIFISKMEEVFTCKEEVEMKFWILFDHSFIWKL